MRSPSDTSPLSLSGVPLNGNKIVRLIYADESGISATDPMCVVAGVIVDADSQWIPVTTHIKELVCEFIPIEDQFNFSFHAKEVFGGTGKVFQDRAKYPLKLRCEILRRLLEVPNRFHLPVAYGCLDKRVERQRPVEKEKPHEREAFDHAIAFSFCAVAAESFMRDYADPREIATMHSENNATTRDMVRLARRSLAGRTKLNLAERMGEHAQRYLPISRIVDEVSFFEKDDAFLLQLADVCAVLLRFAFEGRKQYQMFFDAFTNNQSHKLTSLKQTLEPYGTGFGLFRF